MVGQRNVAAFEEAGVDHVEDDVEDEVLDVWVAESLRSVLDRDMGWEQLPNSTTLHLRTPGKVTYYVGWDGDFFQCAQGGQRIYGYASGDAAADEAEQLQRFAQ